MRWSTVSIEQGHASASIIRKHHKFAGREPLSMRSYLHQIRPLLHVQQQRRLRLVAESRIERLHEKVPRRRSARQQFLSELFLEATSRLPSGASLAHRTRMKLLAEHSKMFADLSDEKKKALQLRADHESTKAMASIADELQGLQVSQGESISFLIVFSSIVSLRM